MDYTKEIRLLRYSAFEKETDSSTIWYWKRKASDITQDKMAQHLEITTKRYREIEKGRLGVNAELLAVLYQNLGYPPSVVFYEDVQNISSLNKVWQEFDSDFQLVLDVFFSCSFPDLELVCEKSSIESLHELADKPISAMIRYIAFFIVVFSRG